MSDKEYMLEYENKDIYIGELEFNNKDGEGIYHFNNGDKYEGKSVYLGTF